jgi:hypothetical protein
MPLDDAGRQLVDGNSWLGSRRGLPLSIKVRGVGQAGLPFRGSCYTLHGSGWRGRDEDSEDLSFGQRADGAVVRVLSRSLGATIRAAMHGQS